MKIVFLGAPGAGKGTQAKRLATALGISHFATGDLLRSAIANQTPVGLLAKPFMESGNLVPDQVVIDLLHESIGNAFGFILDGFPRTLPQAENLAKAFQIDKVIYIDTPEETIVNRLSQRRICSGCSAVYNLDFSPPKQTMKCDVCNYSLIQRNDDKPETIKVRFERFNKDTVPLIQFYGPLIFRVDGSKPLLEVEQQIMGAFSKQ